MFKFVRQNKHTIKYLCTVGFLGVFILSSLCGWGTVNIICQWIILVAIGILVLGYLVNGFLWARYKDKEEGFGLGDLLDRGRDCAKD